MPLDLSKTYLYHITDIENLPGILNAGGLLSDATVGAVNTTVIGYANIKNRRMHEIRVPCCENRFVGQFVPFYFCPRSPMLYSVNKGNTGREVGGQRTIVHLVTSVAHAVALNKPWAFSNGNAGAYHADFFGDLSELDQLDWEIIKSPEWSGDLRRHKKASEFLVADMFDWTAIRVIGCYNDDVAARVNKLLASQPNPADVIVRRGWYY